MTQTEKPLTLQKKTYTAEELFASGYVLHSFRAAYLTREEAEKILADYPDEHTPFLILFDEEETHRFGVCDERDIHSADEEAGA